VIPLFEKYEPCHAVVAVAVFTCYGLNLSLVRRHTVLSINYFALCNQLTPWSLVLLEKLTVAQMIEKFPATFTSLKFYSLFLGYFIDRFWVLRDVS
jgi:hypothetical protein